MKRARLDAMLENAFGFDTETFLIQPGLISPPLVCGSAAWWDPAQQKIVGTLLDKDSARQVFVDVLRDPERVLVGANIAFDLLVMCVDAVKRGIDLLPDVFRALDEGRVYDVQIAEMLDAVAEGCLGKDPRSGGPLVSPETGKRGRYSLSICVDLVLGRSDAKANDEWRLRYGELDAVPIAEWPQTARDYPVDDAINTTEVALAQVGLVPRTGSHRWQAGGVCEWCGEGTSAPPECRHLRSARNLHDLARQVRAAFAMQLGSTWGFHVDQNKVDALETKHDADRAEGAKIYREHGILRPTGSVNESVLKKLVGLAYGASTDRSCPDCAGTGKVPAEDRGADEDQLRSLRWHRSPVAGRGTPLEVRRHPKGSRHAAGIRRRPAHRLRVPLRGQEDQDDLHPPDALRAGVCGLRRPRDHDRQAGVASRRRLPCLRVSRHSTAASRQRAR